MSLHLSMPDYPLEIQFRFEENLIKGQFSFNKEIGPSFLEEEYALSKYYANTILQCAYRKGLLEKSSENGFLPKPSTKQEIISVFQHAEKTGKKPKSLVRTVELTSAPYDVAEKLLIPEGSPIFQQKRSRLIDDVVVANQCNSIPFCITPDLGSLDLLNQSFQVMLESKYHAIVHSIKEDYSLATPTEEDTEILDLEEGQNVVVVHRLSSSATDMPLVWADIHVNPNHFDLVADLWPKAVELIMSQGKELEK